MTQLLPAIIDRAARLFGILGPAEITSDKLARAIVRARYAAILVAREELGLPIGVIAAAFNRDDHTVRIWLRRALELLESDSGFARRAVLLLRWAAHRRKLNISNIENVHGERAA